IGRDRSADARSRRWSRDPGRQIRFSEKEPRDSKRLLLAYAPVPQPGGRPEEGPLTGAVWTRDEDTPATRDFQARVLNQHPIILRCGQRDVVVRNRRIALNELEERFGGLRRSGDRVVQRADPTDDRGERRQILILLRDEGEGIKHLAEGHRRLGDDAKLHMPG